MSKPKILAYYLPQFHPTDENDLWWGKNFTEWTNVWNAKPLFKGHRQPRIPGELGYYDLRMPDTRAKQAALAAQYGIDGFCYWHYWFGNGRRALDQVFSEVLTSGQPNFPFCLAWANHDWLDKKFNARGTSRLLIKQEYPGKSDYKLHFMTLLPAFRDERYIRICNKPVFIIHRYWEVPDMEIFINYWNELAFEHGLAGIYFIAICYHIEEKNKILSLGFDALNDVRIFEILKHESLFKKLYTKIRKKILNRGRVIDYAKAMQYFTGNESYEENVYPTIIPNWDHSPRSKGREHILTNDTAKLFYEHSTTVFGKMIHKAPEHQVAFVKSWNEWGEGNYLEPDAENGRAYLKELIHAKMEFFK